VTGPRLRAAESSRFGLRLAAGQVRYEVLLLLRSPLGTFTALVIPVMVLVALNVATPEMTLRELDGYRFADFLTPAMATFALLNACYVNVITSVVIARENGVLKRLHGTPLPLWAYMAGRVFAAACVAVVSMLVVLGIGTLFLDVDLSVRRLALLAGVAALGVATFTTLGIAVSALVPRPDSALPVAYGTILPIAFVSDVFFPATTAPEWLRHTAAALPVSPLARSAEAIFISDARGWPMTQTQLIVILAWFAGAVLLSAAAFRWEPRAARRPHAHPRKRPINLAAGP